jgi:rhodanese-related sulfurtransferase
MVEEVSPEALRERLEADEGVQVVDIRPEREYERGHVPGALNLPMDRFATGIEEIEWGKDVVVACPIGESSIQAARLLDSYEGVPETARVASLEGGYRAWEYDVETDSGVETDGNDGVDAEEHDFDAPF